MNPSNTAAATVRTMQIIAGALIVGVVLFSAIAWFVVPRGGPPHDTSPLISVLGAAGAVVQVVLAFIVPFKLQQPASRKLVESMLPPQVREKLGQSTEQSGLLAVYQTRMIVAMALLEGAAFFNIVAYIIEQNWWTFAVVGVLLLFLLGMFPTRTRVEQWIENQRVFSDTQ